MPYKLLHVISWIASLIPITSENLLATGRDELV